MAEGLDGALYLDLGNETWDVVKITAQGWRIMKDCPVKFRRHRGMLPLPVPRGGGSIEELRPFVNAPGDEQWRLIVSWVMAALRPVGPFPVLCLHGEQGAAKSTTARILRALIDPSQAPIRSPPRNERDLMIAAANGWVLAYDNLSGMPLWLSNAICRLATGGGFSTRELYTDREEVIFDAMRPVMLNGIADIPARNDLMDRALMVTLPPVLECERRTEKEIWQEFLKARPCILRAFLDAVSCALHHLPSVKLASLPRMADFAEWIVAAEPLLPWETQGFVATYIVNRQEARNVALDLDVVASAAQTFMKHHCEWTGTVSELLLVLEEIVPKRVTKFRAWPKSARALSGRLREAAPLLRAAGFDVDFHRQAHSGRRLVSLKTCNV